MTLNKAYMYDRQRIYPQFCFSSNFCWWMLHLSRVSEIGCPGIRDMPHSCGQVHATRQLSTGQLDILEHETTKYTQKNYLLLLFINYLVVMCNHGGQVKFEILVAHPRDNHTTFGFQNPC
jgi:hypothetical protein